MEDNCDTMNISMQEKMPNETCQSGFNLNNEDIKNVQQDNESKFFQNISYIDKKKYSGNPKDLELIKERFKSKATENREKQKRLEAKLNEIKQLISELNASKMNIEKFQEEIIDMDKEVKRIPEDVAGIKIT